MKITLQDNSRNYLATIYCDSWRHSDAFGQYIAEVNDEVVARFNQKMIIFMIEE